MAENNLKILARLINSSAENLSDEARSIEDPNLFFEFCRDNKLASFLYSLFPKGGLETAFPLVDPSLFKKEFQKSWALNLRFDTIREELKHQFSQRLGLDYLFLDPSLRTRAFYGNRFQQVDEIIQVLIPSEYSLTKISALLRESGFSRIYPEFAVISKIRRKFNFSTTSAYFKRNEFMLRVNTVFPNVLGQFVETGALLQRKERIEISDKQFYVLSEEDYLIYSVLCFLDLRLIGAISPEALVRTYLVMQKGLTGGFGCVDHMLSSLVESESQYIKAVFGNSDISCDKAFGLLDRLRFYLYHSPKVRMFDLFRIFFSLKYL